MWCALARGAWRAPGHLQPERHLQSKAWHLQECQSRCIESDRSRNCFQTCWPVIGGPCWPAIRSRGHAFTGHHFGLSRHGPGHSRHKQESILAQRVRLDEFHFSKQIHALQFGALAWAFRISIPLMLSFCFHLKYKQYYKQRYAARLRSRCCSQIWCAVQPVHRSLPHRLWQ